MVRKLIADKFGTVWRNGCRQASGEIGIDTRKKPLKRAYGAILPQLKLGKTDTHPSLAKRAKKRGAEIYFWDESGFRADVVQGRTWGVRGQTPVIRVPGQRQSVSAASAVNSEAASGSRPQGGWNSDCSSDVLKVLMHRRRKPLMLILDSLPAHKGKAVNNYVESTGGKLELHFLRAMRRNSIQTNWCGTT